MICLSLALFFMTYTEVTFTQQKVMNKPKNLNTWTPSYLLPSTTGDANLRKGRFVVAPSPKRQVPGRFFRSGKGDEVMNLTGGGRLERVQPTSLPAQDSEGRLPL
jgi:hypothetical protein